MSYITIIVLILFGFSFTDFILPKNKTLHEQLYKIAFFITFFLFTIKYYYGADVVNYYKVFNKLPGSFVEVFELTKGKYAFEVGFLYFMAIIKWLGLSYWWMTAIVSMIYFYAIYKLFELIPSYKILALLILVLLDYNLIFATHRQCLAVSFYILMYFSYIDKKYIKMLIYAILTILMHKSGVICVLPVLFLWSLKFFPKRRDFLVCLVFLFLMVLIPLQQILIHVINILPINVAIKMSLSYHVLFFNRYQGILILYSVILFLLFLLNIDNPIYKKMSVIVFVGAITISVFYQSQAILWRLRSYFLPFIVVYLFTASHFYITSNEVTCSRLFNKSGKLVIAIVTIYIMGYSAKSIYSVNKIMNETPSAIYEKSTIFDLISKDGEEIKSDRLQRAKEYWAWKKKTLKKK
ncbi:MAG: EpsG family protein [Paludibacteraceae bacterium]|nr:EpsG family protein [Paludibacteraceae bacterium]